MKSVLCKINKMCFIHEEHCKCCKETKNIVYDITFCRNVKKSTCITFQVRPYLNGYCLNCLKNCFLCEGCSDVKLPNIIFYVDKKTFSKTKYSKFAEVKFFFVKTVLEIEYFFINFINFFEQ